MSEQKVTRRMKRIVKQMRESGAVIREHRDAFREKSWWELHTPDYSISQEITEQARAKLIQAGLIKSIENQPVYRHGKFITSELIYGLVATTKESNDEEE